jgi:hydrogenase nickel incorporation protein HypB
MCVTCGCGEGEVRIEDAAAGARQAPHAHVHRHADGTVHAHVHDHDRAQHHDHDQDHRHAHGGDGHWHRHADGSWHDHEHAVPLGAVHAPGLDSPRRVQIERDLLAANDAIAAANRLLLAERGVFTLNLVSSPGSGKTTLLVKTIEALRGRIPAAVIEGDQQTSRDAERIRATGAPAVQVNTGKGCHLDADMVARALARLDPGGGSLVLIENVGNLVCPAAFDLGEAHKVVVLSVTEGDDKPIKYADMFHAADLMVIAKIDLLPHVDFDVEAAVDFARRVQPGIGVMRVSAKTGAGFDAWLAWLERGVAGARARLGAAGVREPHGPALDRRIA